MAPYRQGNGANYQAVPGLSEVDAFRQETISPSTANASPFMKAPKVVNDVIGPLILEVFGAGGAIWGFSEVVTLRNGETIEYYRKIALFVASVFFARYAINMHKWRKQQLPSKENSLNDNKIMEDDGPTLWGAIPVRLVLEVFGGGGAIWGFSEVCTFRRPDTQEFWRFWAATVGLMFFMRFCLQMKDIARDTVNHPCNKWILFMKTFAAKIVLEVFGGGGAIWGFSEVLTLRRPETQEFWRLNASLVAAIFFLRFSYQMLQLVNDALLEEGSPLQYISFNPRKVIYQINNYISPLILEVFGAGGAIWGFSEVLTLRNPQTQEEYRMYASIVGTIFFARYSIQKHEQLRRMKLGLAESDASPLALWEFIPVKMVLEVFGGGGAIWGFSEVVTFRRPETQHFWRVAAATFGFIFFIRFMLQMMDLIHNRSGETSSKAVNVLKKFAAKIVLEVFGGGGAIWGFSEVLTLRVPATQEFWRAVASVVATLFFVRFCKELIEDINEDDMATSLPANDEILNEKARLLRESTVTSSTSDESYERSIALEP